MALESLAVGLLAWEPPIISNASLYTEMSASAPWTMPGRPHSAGDALDWYYEGANRSHGRMLDEEAITTTLTSTTRWNICSNLDTCTACARWWPTCAWCGSSGLCVPTPPPLSTFVEIHGAGDHVVYDVAELQKSYGGSRGVRTPSCGIWLYKETSCPVVRDYCKGYSESCMACNRIAGCGYCYEGPHQQGDCLPGTYSGEIMLARKTDPCRQEPYSQGPMKQWMFGDWNRFYNFRIWDPRCMQECPQHEVRLTSEGEITLGDRPQLVYYPLNGRCSWEIRPHHWPDGWEMQLVLRFQQLSWVSDSVVVSELPSYQGSEYRPGKEICRNEHGSGMEAWCIAHRPVLISFTSRGPPRTENTRLTIGAWTASWMLGESTGSPWERWSTTTTTRYLIEPPGGYASGTADEYGRGFDGTLTLWIGALIVSLPLVGLLLLAVWRFSRGQPPRGTSNPELRIQALAAAGRPVIVGSLSALERLHPSCRPQVFEAGPQEEAEDNNVENDGNPELTERRTRPKLCSVCLADFESGEFSRELPCKHVFHQQCIDSWLQRRWACPLCRQELPACGLAQAGAGPLAPPPTSIGAATMSSAPRAAPAAPAPRAGAVEDDRIVQAMV